ncbi:helix-turn-helix domain-containing protein [Streptosporangium sp. NPDC001559]|uniref:helix-turn-helix domain-containing protein n=1 Tax=Streptosporangium sp. NPDC001559 TaxID=3366187 RepID=UPI0036ECFBB2
MASKRLSLPFNGQRARHERERQGLTLVALSERCGKAGRKFNHTTLSRWEAGAFVPSAPNLKVLATALDVKVDDLCSPPPLESMERS